MRMLETNTSSVAHGVFAPNFGQGSYRRCWKAECSVLDLDVIELMPSRSVPLVWEKL